MYHCKSCACTADLCSRMQLLRSLFDNICSRSLFTHATFEISVWQHIQQIFVHTCTIWNLCLTIYAAHLCSRMQLLRSLFDNIYSRPLFTQATFEISVWQHIQQIFVHACNFWDLCLTTYTADLCSHMHHLKSLFDNICSTSLFTHATFEISVWQHIQQIFVHASNFWDLCLTTYAADLCSRKQLLRSLFDNIYSRSLFMHATFEISVWQHIQQIFVHTCTIWVLCFDIYSRGLCSCT